MFNGRPCKGLGLHVEQRIVLKAHTNRHAGLQQAFIENAHLSHGIVHGKILVLDQLAASCRHRDRASGNIEGIELNERSPRTLIAAPEDIFV